MDYLKDTALYFQVKEHIKQYIADHGLTAEERLPSEKDLMELYGVSRITLRRALEELEKDGLIHRQHGKGTFVSAHRIQAQLTYLSSFTEDLRERGYTTHAKILEFRDLSPDDVVRNALSLKEGKKVLLLKRIRYADNQPIAIEVCYFSAELFANIIQQDLEHQSLNRIMQNKYGVHFSHAKQWIGTQMADKEMKKIFEFTKPTSILAMRRIVSDIHNTPVQYTVSYYRGDLYEYEVTLPMKNTK